MTTRILFLAALVAFLAGCDTTNSSSVPSGSEAPRLTVTVLTGTKTAPVDSPTVKVDWSHEGKASIEVMTARTGDDYPGDSLIWLPDQASPGSLTFKFHCVDSLRVFVGAAVKVDTGAIGARDTSKTIYCK